VLTAILAAVLSLAASLPALAQDQPPSDPGPAPAFRWREHPSLRFGDLFRIDFQLKLHHDTLRPGDHPVDFDDQELRRFRVGIEGEMLGGIEFSVERELSDREVEADDRDAKDAWKDVFVDIAYINDAQVRIGKFKLPFGLEQLTGIANLDFVHRSLGANYLAPGRDVGVMVHGRFFSRGLNYWAGFFRNDGDNARSRRIEGADDTFAARVTVTPLRFLPALERTEVGASFATSELDNRSELPNGLRGRTVMSEYVFFAPVFVKGRRNRLEADVDLLAGPVGARAEYMQALDNREQQGLGDETLPDARARAWYVSGAIVLTGDIKERPLVPDREFLRGGIGAVELAARYERLYFDSVDGTPPAFRNPRAETILPSANRVFTVGVNWYVNRWVKLMLHTMREELEDVERSPLPGGAAFWSPVFRLQLAL
jgi:phosphate-selective porin